jgi:hypothetical protein
VLIELAGDNKLFEFLPDREFIQLVGFHHTVDRPVDFFLKQGYDAYGSALTAPV